MWAAPCNAPRDGRLRSRDRVETLCAVGMTAPGSSPASRVPTAPVCTRGLFCGQLLPRVLHPLAKPPIPRHLPAHLVHAVNDGRVIAPAEGLADLDQLH